MYKTSVHWTEVFVALSEMCLDREVAVDFLEDIIFNV